MIKAKGWSHWHGRAVILPRDNIDTDQIYPGRFLALTERSDMGEAFFADWRFNSDGLENPNSPFRPGQSVLVAGENFGCGSSREHAVWVMVDRGYRVVLARSFAPIFKQNAIANGIAPILLPQDIYSELCELQNAQVEVTVDLIERRLKLLCTDPAMVKNLSFEIDSFDLHCLRNGLDTLGFLLSQQEHTHKFIETKKNSRHAMHVYTSGGTFP